MTKRILYIGPIPPEFEGEAYGGVATHLWELANYACRKGYDVYILANTSSSSVKNGVKIIASKMPLMLKGIKTALKTGVFNVFRYNNETDFFENYKQKLAITYRAYYLKQVLERVKPDLIHVHSLHNYDNLALKILQPMPIPIVITDHGAYWGVKDRWDLIKIANALSVASCVICVSHHVKEKLEHLMRILNFKPTSLKLQVIYNPIDVNKFPMLDRKKLREKYNVTEKRIIFFSGVTQPIRRKRLDLLLRAVSMEPLLKDKCRLIILTAGEGIQFSKDFISRSGIDGVVISKVPWGKLVEYYNLSDVFVTPSISEPFGLVYVESLLAGTPVIGSHEIIRELENLLGVYTGEKFDANFEGEKELAEKIIKVLNQDFDRTLLRRKVVESLSWDVRFNDFDHIYRSLVHN